VTAAAAEVGVGGKKPISVLRTPVRERATESCGKDFTNIPYFFLFLFFFYFILRGKLEIGQMVSTVSSPRVPIVLCSEPRR